MSIPLCRRISMALVVCICASFCLLPFRVAAGQAEINNLAQPALEQIAKLNNVWVSDDEEAEQILKSLFLVYDTDGVFAQVALEDLEGVAKILSQNGISAIFKEVPIPGSGYGWVLECDSIASFPVNIFGLYAPGGRIIYTPTEEEDDSAATTSRPSYTAPSTSVDVEYTQIFDSTTNTWVDVEINKYDQSVTNNTTNNNHYWDVDNRQFWDVENNTYTTYNDITYNPSTQTYNVQFSDNRSYTYQFYYDYTYITYIGSSAEYREAYKVYYELPDGRSSGDLTVDDLKGLSLQFDMVNYDKAASDTLTQFLFPFDGDVDNVSFYNASSEWFGTPSVSYLVSPESFGGNLFFDGSIPSRLNLSLESPLNLSLLGSSGDIAGFTFQTRLYLHNVGTSRLWLYFNCTYYGLGSSVFDSPVSIGFASINNGVLELPCNGGFKTVLVGGSYYVVFKTQSGTEVININGTWFKRSDDGTWTFNMTQYMTPDVVNALVPVLSSGASYPGIYSVPLPVGQWFDLTFDYWMDSDSFEDYFNVYVNGVRVPFSFNSAVFGMLRTIPYPSSVSSPSNSDSASWSFPRIRSVYGVSFVSGSSGGPQFGVDNTRFVSTSLYTGIDSFTPSPVPFDTNLAYVLPSVADLNDNTVAIMSQLPVSGYRVGGIRPTDPTLAAGYVWMHIDGEFVDSVQQWNGAYWEEVTARLYTGVRWIPVTAFNVFTLEDMFDIIDPDGDGSGESVSTIYQYYLWWSGEWGTFQQWLQGTMDTLIEAIQNSGSGGSGEVVIVPGYNDQTTTNEITTENPDGSTTVTTIVSNAAGLVYSRSVTTWPPDADGNVTTREVYTDSTGVMYQTTIVTDKDGNVTVTEPSEATGTLASILKTITQGVMSIATSVIQAFVDLLVDLVGFVLDSVGRIFSGITNILGTLLSALTSFVAELGTAAQFLPAFFSILPAPIQAGFTLIFVGCVAIGLFRLIHF